jgi:dTDP-4-dehydrorhamnose reductase
MLGAEFSRILEQRGLPYTATDREIDVTDPAALAAFAGKRPWPFPLGWIVNCAAYTAVDKAEDDAENCRRLNTLGAANIARAAQHTGAKLIHLSTDYVFNGRGIKTAGAPRPYREDDPTDPVGVYGLTKRDGETLVFQQNKASYVIRTAWLYGEYGKNFVDTMLRLMKEKAGVKVVNDQTGSPTWARDLANLMADMITIENDALPYGVYHYTNEGAVTWFDFAGEIYRQGQKLGILTGNCTVCPCASEEFPAKVNRPAYSVLDKTKIKKTMNMDIPCWDKSLAQFLEQKVKEHARA